MEMIADPEDVEVLVRADDSHTGGNEESSPSIPLVKLTLENITYQPLCQTTSSKSSAASTSTSKKNDDQRSAASSASISSNASRTKYIRKTILRNVTPPPIEPYKLQGWMGPSGSGKTTLLSIAAGLMQPSDDSHDFSPESSIKFNGSNVDIFGKHNNDNTQNKQQVDQQYPKGLVGMVWQDDLLLSNLTVRETIEFAAKLKTPQGIISPTSTSSEKQARQKLIQLLVDEILSELGLVHIQHSLIGQSVGSQSSSQTRGISGGERKRVSVAQELVTRPPILFLDEPTSGLDSSSALELMTCLKTLATQGGHSIVAVVHQPRTKIFDLLDGLLLLSKGEEVYSGPAVGARRVLESCPIVGYKLPDQTNVADWIIDLIRSDEDRYHQNQFIDLNKDDEEAPEDELQHYDGLLLPRHWSSWRKGNGLTLENNKEEEEGNDLVLSSLEEIQKSLPKYTTTFSGQLKLLLARSMKQRRGERLTQTAWVVMIVYVLFESLFWFRLPNDSNHVYERNSIMFFLIIAQSNQVVVNSVTTFQSERALMMRERAKKMYSVLPYFLAKTFADMTTTLLVPVVNMMIVYWTVNLRPTAGAYFTSVCFFYLTLNAAQSMGLFLSVTIPNMQLSLLVSPAITLFLMIVAGFYIPLASLPSWISWLQWISFATYGYSGLLITEFGGRQIPCADGETRVTYGDGNTGESSCPLPGDDILLSLGVDGLIGNSAFCAFMLIVLQAFFRIGAYSVLRLQQ